MCSTQQPFVSTSDSNRSCMTCSADDAGSGPASPFFYNDVHRLAMCQPQGTSTPQKPPSVTYLRHFVRPVADYCVIPQQHTAKPETTPSTHCTASTAQYRTVQDTPCSPHDRNSSIGGCMPAQEHNATKDLRSTPFAPQSELQEREQACCCHSLPHCQVYRQ